MLKSLLNDLEANLFDEKLLKYENDPVTSRQENFYTSILRAVPSLNTDPKKNWQDRVVFSHQICEGLKSVDIYVPEWDLVIEFDGPPHYLQSRISQLEQKTHIEFEELDNHMMSLANLDPFLKPQSRILNRIMASQHKKVVHFDYQAHNVLYHMGVLGRC